jgi:hypothetical protein
VRILDLGAGEGDRDRRKRIEARGHEYITVDYDPRFGCTETADIFTLTAEYLRREYGPFDFGWFSPSCEAFSVAAIGHHWTGGHRAYIPKTEHAEYSQKLVEHGIRLLIGLWPSKGFRVENPRGVLRKLPCVANLPRDTITYCAYGDHRMKPTDIWGWSPGWVPRPMCKNGMPCHEAAPRGAKTGTQGIKGAAARSIVPWQLWEDLLIGMESA